MKGLSVDDIVLLIIFVCDILLLKFHI